MILFLFYRRGNWGWEIKYLKQGYTAQGKPQIESETQIWWFKPMLIPLYPLSSLPEN